MSTEIGQRAETLAAEYLIERGCQVLERNWRTKICEIDLVVRDGAGIIRFVEVKYRRSNSYGSGFDYITPDKVRRLRRAALIWMSVNRQEGDYRIDVIAVHEGKDGPELQFLPNAVNEV
ncbi:MAG TPA: YraN family protein [Candidatus Nanoarchaeia archaeon]|nr:YraN family protein [Candidatus Nanoarchaeia archaeon]